MSKDILSFTKDLSGIDIADYVIRCVDQHMIIYPLLRDCECTITPYQNGEMIVSYKVSGLNKDDIYLLNQIPKDTIVGIYNTSYRVSINYISDKSEFEITISGGE